MKVLKEWTVGEFVLSTDKDRLDYGYIHAFLESSYWSPGVPMEVVKRSIENSLCIGVFTGDKQIGFARVITDSATFAYLADVFIDEAYRGRGLSKKLMDFLLSFDFVGGLRRFLLATRDAHGLYRQFGFEAIEPDRFMEIHKPKAYLKGQALL